MITKIRYTVEMLNEVGEVETKSGVAVTLPDPLLRERDKDWYMVMYGAGLASLYRHEHEKLFGTPPVVATLFRHDQETGKLGIKAELVDPPKEMSPEVERYTKAMKAARQATAALIERYGPKKEDTKE